MKSVGEVMAIGRTFEESLQKAMRMTDTSVPGYEQCGAADDLTDVRAIAEPDAKPNTGTDTEPDAGPDTEPDTRTEPGAVDG